MQFFKPNNVSAGLIGTAPSPELLAIWNERERKLNSDGPDALTLGGARPFPGVFQSVHASYQASWMQLAGCGCQC